MTRACIPGLKKMALALVLAASLWAPAAALAQNAEGQDAQTVARQRYQNGKLFYEKAQYAEALKEFEAAYAAKPHPVVLKSIAECKVLLQDIPGAIASLEEALADSRSTGEARQAIEQRVGELRSLVGTLDISSAPAGAEIAVDGKATGKATPAKVVVGLGDHEVTLTTAGFEPMVKAVKVGTGGQTLAVSADFEKEGAALKPESKLIDPFADEGAGKAEGPEAAARAEVRPKKEKGGPHPSFWACAAVAGAGLISGTVFGTMALNDEDDYNKNPTKEKKDAGERNALIADISFGVAVAAAIAGTVVILAVDRDKSEKKVDANKQAAKVDVVPLAGRDAVGLSTTVRF